MQQLLTDTLTCNQSIYFHRFILCLAIDWTVLLILADFQLIIFCPSRQIITSYAVKVILSLPFLSLSLFFFFLSYYIGKDFANNKLYLFLCVFWVRAAICEYKCVLFTLCLKILNKTFLLDEYSALPCVSLFLVLLALCVYGCFFDLPGANFLCTVGRC